MAEMGQIYKGATDILVLAVLEKGESYGYEILRVIGNAGTTRISDASIYGTLKRLEEQGLVQSRLVASNSGPARRYYDITKSGETGLKEAAEGWQEITDTISRLMRKDTHDDTSR